jgi:glycosyltransferase involved in cell wall biosynthesis
VTEVHVIVPNDIDDPATPSGGNAYDRRMCHGLTELGWKVHEYAVRGPWPRPGVSERTDLARTLATLPDNAVALIDGLVASAAPEVLVPEARRLHLVVLVHMPLGDQTADMRSAEHEALSAAAVVITTSAWSKRRLLDLYALEAGRVQVATPGVDVARVVPGSAAGSELIYVAALTPHKGHDLLTQALATIADMPWSCVCVGALTRDPGFVERLRRQIDAHGLTDRIRLVGPRTGPHLDDTYAAADLLVLASRAETYGLVVTEALARGIPVVASAVGGVPEALGHASDGSLPGLLVAAGDASALARALRQWLGDSGLRQRLRRSARDRRASLEPWRVTADRVSNILTQVATGARG